jgi:hypothetical protein
MTTDEMQSKINQYEKALNDVLIELCNQVINAGEQKDAGASLTEIESGRLDSVLRLVTIAATPLSAPRPQSV